MPDRVNTTMDDAQRSVTNPALDHVRGHAEPLQLPPGDDAMLLRRQRR